MPPDIARQKSDDRYKQMREIFKQEVKDGDLPDPKSMATFLFAKIPWQEYARDNRQEALRLPARSAVVWASPERS